MITYSVASICQKKRNFVSKKRNIEKGNHQSASTKENLQRTTRIRKTALTVTETQSWHIGKIERQYRKNTLYL